MTVIVYLVLIGQLALQLYYNVPKLKGTQSKMHLLLSVSLSLSLFWEWTFLSFSLMAKPFFYLASENTSGMLYQLTLWLSGVGQERQTNKDVMNGRRKREEKKIAGKLR
jgi:hypothetical protein